MKIVYALLAMTALLAAAIAQAQDGGSSSQSSNSSRASRTARFAVELGARGMVHYRLLDDLKIPRPSLLAEAQLNLFLSDSFSLYLLYGHSIAMTSSSEVGMGAKFRFLSFKTGSTRSATIQSISFEFAADVIQYKMEPPVRPYYYENTGTPIRIGGALVITFKGGSYLNMMGQGTRFAQVWMLCPYIAYGISF